MKQKGQSWTRMLGQAITLSILIGLMVSQVHAADFLQLYERGKLLLKQRLYVDAIKEFKKATYTTRGQKYFGVYFYLSVAHLKLSKIQKAGQYLKIAKRLAKKKRHQAAAKRLESKILALYGNFRITPEVDPDEVGRLKLILKPNAAFSNKSKARFYKRLAKRLKGEGVIPNNRLIYLPKGEYSLSIIKPQCLKYSLRQGDTQADNLSISSSTVVLTLKEGASCKCTGGQKLYRIGKKLTCTCPPGLGWNKSKQRCETGVNPVPWIIGSVAVLGGLGVAAAIIVPIIVSSNATPSAQVQGTSVWNTPTTP